MLSGLPLLWLQLQFAWDIYKTMDTSVNPCVDFYNYACGNFKNVAPLPEDKAEVNRFSQTDDQLKKNLKSMYEEMIFTKSG